jgi:hypothetical protein
MTMSKHKNRELSRENHTKPGDPGPGGDHNASTLTRWVSIIWALLAAMQKGLISTTLGSRKPENKKKCEKPKRLRMNSTTYPSGNPRKTRLKPKKTRLKPTKTRLNPTKLAESASLSRLQRPILPLALHPRPNRTRPSHSPFPIPPPFCATLFR